MVRNIRVRTWLGALASGTADRKLRKARQSQVHHSKLILMIINSRIDGMCTAWRRTGSVGYKPRVYVITELGHTVSSLIVFSR